MKKLFLIGLCVLLILLLAAPVFSQGESNEDILSGLDRRDEDGFPDEHLNAGMSVQSMISEVNQEGVPIIRVRLRHLSELKSVVFVGTSDARIEIRDGLTDNLIYTTNANQSFTIEVVSTGIRIKEFDILRSSVKLIPLVPNNRTRINWPGESARDYRGFLEVSKTSLNFLHFVNQLSLEEYLYGVVPNEMPASWGSEIAQGAEALKAQAITARTYALANFNYDSGAGYNLCDWSGCCQAYLTSSSEHANSTAAVNATSGMVLNYNGKLISTYYSSSSGGYTESYYNWGMRSETSKPTDFPHLQAVLDPYDNTPTNTRHSWTRTFTLEDLTTRFSSYNIGQVVSIEATKPKTESGRQMEITVRGTDGDYVVFGQSNIRRNDKGFGLFSARFDIKPKLGLVGLFTKEWSNADALPAIGAWGEKCEVILDGAHIIGAESKVVLSSTPHVIGYVDRPTEYEFVGGGWGHGVGMSQYGAYGMARSGKTCEEILKHYYRGVDVVKDY